MGKEAKSFNAPKFEKNSNFFESSILCTDKLAHRKENDGDLQNEKKYDLLLFEYNKQTSGIGWEKVLTEDRKKQTKCCFFLNVQLQ